MGASGSSGTNVVRKAAVTKRKTEDLPLEDDQQYFIEPVLPNKIEHALQEESQMSQEKAVDFESTKTHEEQLKESVDLVNMKTPNVMGSSTQPIEGVERVELVAGEKSEAKEEIEESKEKVTLKKGKPKDKENNKTTPEKMGGMETVSLNSGKQRNIKDSTKEDGEVTRHGDSRNVTEKEEGTKETPAKTKGAAVKDTENHIDQEKPAIDLKERREPKETKKGTKEEEQLRTASAGKTNVAKRIVSEGTSEATRTAKEATTSVPSSSSSKSGKNVEPKKKLSHSTSREEDKVQIKVPDTKRKQFDTATKTHPIQKEDSTELKYVVQEPTEEREGHAELKKSQLDVVEVLDEPTAESERPTSFTVQEPETPDTPDGKKVNVPEKVSITEEESRMKGGVQTKMPEEKSTKQQIPSKTKNQEGMSREKTSRDYKTEHIKSKPQDKEVSAVGFREI